MKRLGIIMLSLAMTATIFVGCQPKDTSGDNTTDTPKTEGAKTDDTASSGEKVLNIYLGPQTETIDPNKNSTSDGAMYINHLFEPLMRYKPDGTGTEFGSAESYEVSEDGLVYTYKIRDTAIWSDGEPVVAADFEFSFKRLVNPETVAPYAQDMGKYIKNGLAIADGEKSVDELGVKAIDDHTFEVTLEAPCEYFDEIMAFPVFNPLRQDIIDANGDKWATDASTYISNGAYKMESYTLDSEIVVVRNEDYWDTASIIPDQINFKLIADANTALVSVRAGEVDYARNVPSEEIPALKEEGLYHIFPLLGTYYASYNLQQAPFDNPLVRKAFTLAIDSQYIAEVVRQGSYLPLSAIVGAGYQDVDTSKDFRTEGTTYYDVNEREKNIEEAKKALAEAGYPNGEGFPKVEYMFNEGGGHDIVAQALQQNWKEVLGVEVGLAQQEWSVFVESRRKGNFQMARNGWISDYNDPSAILTIFTSTSTNNDGKYSNPEFDRLMAVAATSTDREERFAAMHAAEDILMADFAAGPIYGYAEEITSVPELQNYGNLSLGYVFFHYASKTNW